MGVPKAFVGFDVEASTLTLWVFKKFPVKGAAPKYTGRWIDTDAGLDTAIKSAILAERERITEVQEYGLLAQNNEGSALRIDALETNAGLILEQAGAEVAPRKVKEMEEIRNTDFYVIKLARGTKVLYAVRKTESSWQTRKVKDAIYTFFSNKKLGLDDKPSFRISRQVDFFVFDDQVLIAHKGHFESILSYKEAHIEDFTALQKESAFKGIFSDLDPLVGFVGTNKIHLRRACAIRAKGHYKNKDFMTRLRKFHGQHGLKLQFADDGRLIPTEETCADIIRALLDHRLSSPFSEQDYDVDNAIVVSTS
jgi:hypothetical protein